MQVKKLQIQRLDQLLDLCRHQLHAAERRGNVAAWTAHEHKLQELDQRRRLLDAELGKLKNLN